MDKENDNGAARFKRMSKSPHGLQKPKILRSAEDNDGNKGKRPAQGARRSLAMEDKVKNVSSDNIFDQLTTLEADVVEKTRSSVKVVISDSRLSVRTPQNGLASGLIKNILQRKWQHVVNMLFKVDEALPHLQAAVTRAVNQEFKWFCCSKSMLTMKSPEQIVQYSNKSLLDETSKKCPIYFSCILGTAGLIRKQKEMDWKTVNATAAATTVLARKRNSRMSAFAYRISSILIHSGAKTTDFTTLNRLGICMSHQETVRKQKEMGQNFGARVLEWEEAAEKEKASASASATVSIEVEANPCNNTSGTSMEVSAQPETFKHYRYIKDGLD